MELFSVNKFSGQAPRVAPRQLPENFAQVSLNTKLWSTLEPFRDTLFVEARTAASQVVDTIYPMGQTISGLLLVDQPYSGFPMGGGAMGVGNPVSFSASSFVPGSYLWTHWPKDVDVVRGAIPGDVTERTYITGDGAPKYTTLQAAMPSGIGGIAPAITYPLGIPAPTNTPTCVPAIDIIGGSGVAEIRSYVYTFVSSSGEESAPSPPLVINSPLMLPGGSVTIHNLGRSLNATVTSQRIYRTNTAANGVAQFQFVAEIPIASISYTDTLLATQLAEILPSTDWLPPPGNLRGIKSMPGGMMVGFFNNVVCLCVPYMPYAWPLAYQYTTEFPIVGLGVFGSNVVVLTSGNPYLLTGIDPSAMSMSKIPLKQPCVSKRSIVDMGFGVAYASPDGIFLIGSYGGKIVTDQYFTRDEWQALNPKSISGYVLDGRYFGFYKTATTSGGFIFDPNSQDNAVVFIDTYATAGYADLVTDSLYLLVGTNIVQWDAATTLKVMTWHSKVFVAKRPVNLGYAQVRAAAYPVTLRVFASGLLKATKTIVNEEAIKLPSGFLSRDWEFEIQGSNEIYSVTLSDSIGAMQSV